MSRWRRILGDRPIVTRLVLAVAATMTIVLLGAGAFVFWRVGYALDRQLDQDLAAYAKVVDRAVTLGSTPPSDTPGLSYQVYDGSGRVVGGDAVRRLLDEDTVAGTTGEQASHDVGHLLPPSDHPYRVVTQRVGSAGGTVVVASAISRSKHDEALRELLLQLALADLVTLLAASLVGYGVARAALNPVERYRRAAEGADGATPLPVPDGKDDEVTRLGHTFNALLDRINVANERERQFLADASHELRSPLAVMRAEVDLALFRPRGEEENRVTLESLRDQIERLVTISETLLELEELGATGVRRDETVGVDDLVADLVHRFTPQAALAGRRLEAPGLGDTPVRMDGNRHWLDLALRNLISNALRYGEGTVTVTAAQAAGRTTLTVGDEGPGFSPDFVDRAFDRFSRADSSRSTRGTGLGLALVGAVAEGHGGTARIVGPSVVLDLPTRSD